MEDIKIGKYILYNAEGGNFYLCPVASHIIYRQKGIICSYSGASEWCNHFFCQLIDLFSGGSPYNYALGCFEHEKEIPRVIEQEDGRERLVDWITEQQQKKWWKKMVESFEFMVENFPKDSDD